MRKVVTPEWIIRHSACWSWKAINKEFKGRRSATAQEVWDSRHLKLRDRCWVLANLLNKRERRKLISMLKADGIYHQDDFHLGSDAGWYMTEHPGTKEAKRLRSFFEECLGV